MRDNGGAGARLPAVEEDFGKPAIGKARDRGAVMNALMLEGKDFATAAVWESFSRHAVTMAQQ
ncbi:MAG: hypothetical protein ABSE69_14975 [Roseiarcus sp.]